jgi:hypothetical protein
VDALGDDRCGDLAVTSVFSSCVVVIGWTGVDGREASEFVTDMLSYCLQLAPIDKGCEVCMFARGGSPGEGNGLIGGTGRRRSAPGMICGGCIVTGDAVGRNSGTNDGCATGSC